MSSKSVIEISLQYIFNGQYWILVHMCFTVSSKMRKKAIYKCSSLVDTWGLSLSFQHCALCTGTLKFHPALVIAKVVLLIGQVFGSVQGPYLYGMPALGFLLFLPLRTRSYARLSVKDAILWKLQLQFSFITKTQSC